MRNIRGHAAQPGRQNVITHPEMLPRETTAEEDARIVQYAEENVFYTARYIQNILVSTAAKKSSECK